MARESIQKTIDGDEYTFYQLGALQSNKLLWKIKRIVGPALAGMMEGAKGSKIDSILDSDVDFESILNGLYERATDDEVDFIIYKLLEQVHHSGDGVLSKGTVDSHFKGRLSTMYKVVWEAFKHEYSDFLGESGIVASLSQKVSDGNRKK